MPHKAPKNSDRVSARINPRERDLLKEFVLYPGVPEAVIVRGLLEAWYDACQREGPIYGPFFVTAITPSKDNSLLEEEQSAYFSAIATAKESIKKGRVAASPVAHTPTQTPPTQKPSAQE